MKKLPKNYFNKKSETVIFKREKSTTDTSIKAALFVHVQQQIDSSTSEDTKNVLQNYQKYLNDNFKEVWYNK
jgi:hypothetical protein